MGIISSADSRDSQLIVQIFDFLAGLPEPGFLAGAGAEIVTRLRLLLLLLLYNTLNILFLRDLSMTISMTMTTV